MGIVKKAKKILANKTVKRSLEIGKGGLSALAAVNAAKKGDVGRSDKKGSAAIKAVLGKKGYKSLVQGEKKLIGDKNAKLLTRVKETGVQLGSAAYSLKKGDLKGAEQHLGKGIAEGVGRGNLRVAEHFGQDLIGKKNYNAIHKYGKRGLETGLSLASAIGAASTGNELGALKYGTAAVRQGVGAEKIHQGQRLLKKKIGEDNYNMLMNSYKAAQLGIDLAKGAHGLNNAYEKDNKVQMLNKSIKLAKKSKQAYELFKDVHDQANASHVPVGHPIVTAGDQSSVPSSSYSSGPIGGSSKKPMIMTPIGGGGKKPAVIVAAASNKPIGGSSGKPRM